MRNWKVTGNYPQWDGTGAVVDTQVIITDDRGAVISEKVKKDLRTAKNIKTISSSSWSVEFVILYFLELNDVYL
ncbi:TPA: hypothetical protein VHJ24_000676 [Streptococcus pyogenes]|nr:hypothetical protein [Streptococcus pyogenes]